MSNLKEVRARSVYENFEKSGHHTLRLADARIDSATIKTELTKCLTICQMNFTNLVPISTSDLERREYALGVEIRRIRNEILKRELKLNILTNNTIIEKCDELIPKHTNKLARSESETEGDEQASKLSKKGNCCFCFDFFFVC